MKNEIKEILDYLKRSNKNLFGYEQDKIISYEEVQLLLDYITNLQKEDRINNDLIPYFKNNEKSLKKQITNLQEENERLKETNVYCNRTDCVGRIKDSKKYDSVYQEKEDYDKNVEQLLVEKLELEQELQRKDNNWNELKEWLKEDEELANFEVIRVRDILDKINKLERKK